MKKRKKSFPKITVLLLAASAVLLVGSGVGSARAALTYYSENYSAQMNMQSIGVSLVENDAVVSSRDYVSDNEWSGSTEGTMSGAAIQRASFWPVCLVRMRSLHRANAIMKPSA